MVMVSNCNHVFCMELKGLKTNIKEKLIKPFITLSPFVSVLCVIIKLIIVHRLHTLFEHAHFMSLPL